MWKCLFLLIVNASSYQRFLVKPQLNLYVNYDMLMATILTINQYGPQTWHSWSHITIPPCISSNLTLLTIYCHPTLCVSNPDTPDHILPSHSVCHQTWHSWSHITVPPCISSNRTLLTIYCHPTLYMSAILTLLTIYFAIPRCVSATLTLLGLIESKGSGSCLNQISRFKSENDTKSIVHFAQNEFNLNIWLIWTTF